MVVCAVGKNTMLGKIKENIHDPEESSFLGSSNATFAKLMVFVGAFFSVIMLCVLIYYDNQELKEEEGVGILSE